MEKSYISIKSDKEIVYEGEGSIFVDDWRLKVDGGILSRPWYSLLEIRQDSDGKVKVLQTIVYKEDFYRIGDRPIFGGTCNLSFLEKVLKSFGGKSIK